MGLRGSIRGVALCGVLLGAACSSDEPSITGGMGTGGSSGQSGGDAGSGGSAGEGGVADGGSGTATTGSTNDTTTATTGFDGGLSGDAGSDAEAGPAVLPCGEKTLQPTLGKPVDIVWVIDSSGSMTEEAAAVANNLVAFADRLQTSQLDYRLVVISRSDFVPEYGQLSSSLPPERFLFVDEEVGSFEPLADLLATHPRYAQVLRPSAVTHFIAVTDDESCMGTTEECGSYNFFGGFTPGTWTPAEKAEHSRTTFTSEMNGLLGHGFVFHAVASPDPTCQGAYNPGNSYYQLAAESGGRTFPVCAPDWSALFEELGSAVDSSAKVACSVPIPDPPQGYALNPELVYLDFTLENATSSLAQVLGKDGCDGGDWFFDRPVLPQEIELCPARCDMLRTEPTAKLDVRLECAANPCAGVRTAAEIFSTPVDIVWVIDSSESMQDEMAKIGANLQAFADDIASSGVDFRVIVVRSPSAPLNLPGGDRFVPVDVEVGANQALLVTLAQFGEISPHLRSGATTHFVFVSDDESALLRDGTILAQPADVPGVANNFVSRLTEQLGGDFIAHAVASEDPVCSSSVVNPGRVFYQLAQQTGGTTFSICQNDWSLLFERLSDSVLTSAPIACSFELPDPPRGQMFSADEVNVSIGFSGAQASVLGRTTADACDAGGWHYDDEDRPKRIELCEPTCQQLQGKLGAAVDIELGCETLYVPIE